MFHTRQLIEFLPQLYDLCISHSVTLKTIKEIRIYRFVQIRKLQRNIFDEYADYVMEELVRLSPCVEDFVYNSPIESEQLMFRCIDGWKYLEHASFSITYLRDYRMSDFYHSTSGGTRYK